MAIKRYAVDGLNGSSSATGVATAEGDFSNAVLDIYDAIDKANTIHQADATDTVIIEVSGGPSGITYQPTRNLVFTNSGTPYTAAGGFGPTGNAIGQYGIVGSEAAGHDGQVTIDAQNIVTYDIYNAVLASKMRGTLYKRLRVINVRSASPSIDAIHLSVANYSAVRECILEQGSHAIWAKNAEDLEITRNIITGGTGANGSAIKVQQTGTPLSTRALIAHNFLLNGGSSTGSAGHFGIQLYGCLDCQVYHNTVINTVTDGIGIIEGSKNNLIYNNIVMGSTANGNSGAVGHDIAMDAESALGDTNTIDNNSYGTNKYYLGGTFSASTGWIGGNQYTSLADWQSNTSQDANSITSLPTFVGDDSITNAAADVKLVSGSPQIGSGAVLSWEAGDAFSDINGIAYESPPNMGAVASFTGASVAPESSLTEGEQAYLTAWEAGNTFGLIGENRESDNLRIVNLRFEAGAFAYELIGNYINWDHILDNYNFKQTWSTYTKPAGRDFGTKRINDDGLISGNYIHTDYPEND